MNKNPRRWILAICVHHSFKMILRNTKVCEILQSAMFLNLGYVVGPLKKRLKKYQGLYSFFYLEATPIGVKGSRDSSLLASSMYF